MKNAGLPPLDMIEVKQRDKDYKRACARNRLRTVRYYKGFTSRYVHIQDAVSEDSEIEG